MRIQFIEHKGVGLGVFWDENNAECSFQADKRNDNDYVWLGVNVDITGKQGFRMLLDKNKAKIIVEILKQFIETGKTPTKVEEMPQSITSKKQE